MQTKQKAGAYKYMHIFRSAEKNSLVTIYWLQLGWYLTRNCLLRSDITSFNC